MGFSFKKMFSGSGWKKFKGVVGGVLKVATSVIPGVGGLAGGVVGKLMQVKAVKGVTSTVDKLGGSSKLANLSKGIRSTAMVLKASPVMPGGSYATPMGVAPAPTNGAYPPGYYGGGLSGFVKPKRRKARTATKKKRTTTKRRTSSGRKLKFGSPAWRKKYLSKSYLAKKAKKRKAAS